MIVNIDGNTYESWKEKIQETMASINEDVIFVKNAEELLSIFYIDFLWQDDPYWIIISFLKSKEYRKWVYKNCSKSQYVKLCNWLKGK